MSKQAEARVMEPQMLGMLAATKRQKRQMAQSYGSCKTGIVRNG